MINGQFGYVPDSYMEPMGNVEGNEMVDTKPQSSEETTLIKRVGMYTRFLKKGGPSNFNQARSALESAHTLCTTSAIARDSLRHTTLFMMLCAITEERLGNFGGAKSLYAKLLQHWNKGETVKWF